MRELILREVNWIACSQILQWLARAMAFQLAVCFEDTRKWNVPNAMQNVTSTTSLHPTLTGHPVCALTDDSIQVYFDLIYLLLMLIA